MLTLPNLLSTLRLAMVPLLLWLAWNGQRPVYLACLVASLATDFLDGLLARLLKQTSALGTKLDSWADLCTYLSLPICVWWLWPDIVQREAILVSVAVVSYLTAVLAGVVRYGRLTSYHTWLGKVTAIIFPVAVLLLLSGLARWAFEFTVPLVVIAEIEEVGITIVLPEWRCNVPSIWHAFRLRHQSH